MSKNSYFLMASLAGFIFIGTLLGVSISKEKDNANDTNTTTIEPDLVTDTMETPLVGETDDAV